MNFINPNQEHPQFINTNKNDSLPIELNLNQYNQNSQTNRSISFTFFNNTSLKYPLLSDKNQPFNPSKQQDNPDISLSIGFNKNHQNFFEHSLRFPNQEDFKNASIKKTPTFQCTQGFLNQINQSTQTKIQNQHIDHIHQKKSIKNQNNQNCIKSGSHQNQDLIKTQFQYQMKHQHQQPFHPKKLKESTQTKEKSLQNQLLSQNNLQNLKAIAKLAFQGIKRQKLASYQSISTLMLSQMNDYNNSQDRNHYNKNCHSSTFQNQQKKNKIIESMIKSKSFKGVQLIAEIEQQEQISYDSGSHKQGTKYQGKSNDSDQKQSTIQNKRTNIKNLKNIRRRLYDAINVMLAAKIIQKRQNGYLSLRSPNTKKVYKNNIKSSSNTGLQEGISIDELQKKIYEKKKQVEAKRRYKDLLITKCLTLEKHINKNKSLETRSSHINQRKLYFPLIFTSAQLPMKINLMQMGSKLQIQSPQQFDISCDIDVLGLLYWIEKQQIINKLTQISKSSQQFNLKRLSSSKDNNQGQKQEQIVRKKIKIDKQQ